MVLYVLREAIASKCAIWLTGKAFLPRPAGPSPKANPPLKDRRLTICDFLETPAGRILCAWEREKVGKTVEDCFGYRALQVGMPEIDFLAGNRIAAHFCTVAESEKADCRTALKRTSSLLYAEPEALPFASESFDLVVLPHALDFAGGPQGAQRVLREAARVLMPQGRLVLTAFNPSSLWGARQRLADAGIGAPFLPDAAAMVPLSRLRDWLSLLSLEIDRGAFGAYEPPCRKASGMRRWSWFNQAGDRWWPSLGAAVMLAAVKQTEGMKLVGSVAFSKSRRLSGAGAVPLAETARAEQLDCVKND